MYEYLIIKFYRNVAVSICVVIIGSKLFLDICIYLSIYSTHSFFLPPYPIHKIHTYN